MSRLIRTAGDVHGIGDPRRHEGWIRQAAEAIRAGGYANQPETIRPISDVADFGRPAIAEINHATWIARCPNDDGGAAMLVPDHPMMCPYCCNADIDGRWRPVIWPAQRDEIEAILGRRMLAQHRNWHPERTNLAEMVAENAAHPELVRMSA